MSKSRISSNRRTRRPSAAASAGGALLLVCLAAPALLAEPATPAPAGGGDKPAAGDAAALQGGGQKPPASIHVFQVAKDAFTRGDYKEAARGCYDYISRNPPSSEKYESAQFYLAGALEKLGFYHAAVEYYFQVANTRRMPELLPRALRVLESITLSKPFDQGLIIRDLLGDTDFGDLPSDLADFVYYHQGVDNLQRGLDAWATERFSKISRRGYYFFSALYTGSIRLLKKGSPESKKEAVTSFANLFGALDLGAAVEAIRRRGEGDTKLAYAVKALVNEDNEIDVRFEKLPEGYETELAMLGLARIAAETRSLLDRAKTTDEEILGLPISYSVSIGGMPIYTKGIRFEERTPAIKAVASRMSAIRGIEGMALHSLARLLYGQKQFAATYATLGKIPSKTELGSEILLERAWSKYKSGDPHRAMGLVYALDAPVYRTLFAPEKFLLRGLIYRRFCHFRSAKLAARQFRYVYGRSLRELREGKPESQIKTIREAAKRRVQSRKLYLFHRSLENELEASTSSRYEDAWGPNGLQRSLVKLYRQKLKEVGTDLERSLEHSSREVAEEMLQAEEQVNLLEYEIGQAIFQRVGEAGGAVAVKKQAAKVPIASGRVYYRFDDEYWTDELPHYKFNIEDRCVE
jgi:hypothetical protein